MMNNIVKFVVIFFISYSNLYSQNKEDYKWIFGENYNPNTKTNRIDILDFSIKGRIDTIYTHDSVANHNAEISDKDGNLLFYANGCRIIDSSFQIMENGDSINFGKTWKKYCSSYATYPGPGNSIILPDPGNATEGRNGYYLIHKRQELITVPYLQVSIPELYYSYIDMNGNSGRGKVTKKNQTIFKTTNIVSGYLTACKHSNGRDWWLIQMEQDTNIYFKVLLTKDGFRVDSQSIEEVPKFIPRLGQSVFTPDGKKWITNGAVDQCMIFDFDRESGMLSNLIRVMPQDSGLFYGVAVSPNSRFAYLSDCFDLFQIDLWSDDMQSSLTHIAYVDGFRDPNFFSLFGQAQLAPDCKIYIVNSGTNNWLHVINKPDEKGKDCDFRQHSVYLPNRNYNNSIPNFPHFRMDEAEICDPNITSLFGDAVWYRRDLDVWPNPSSGVFNVELPDVGAGKLVVSNISGQVVYEREVSTIIKDERIDISGYPSGTYNVEFYPKRLAKERMFYGDKITKLE